MENLLLLGIYFASFYAFLPGLISRIFGFRVFKKGLVKKEIALTFDDGPDPVYTPKLLDLLARYQVKATFFIVGSHAEKQTELLQRMKAEGHVIGIHNYVHKSNWLMRPRTVRRQIQMTADIIEKATGDKPIFYRPPWGIINLFDYANLGHLHIILWSSLFGDWRMRLGADRLKKRMMKKLRPGEVLLLHDCGRTFGADKDAPANMLIALAAYLEEGMKQGYRFVSIDEMMKLTDAAQAAHTPIWKKGLIKLWLLWERAYHAVFQLKIVGDKDQPAFHYRVTQYNGQPVELSNGSSISKGDPIVELHFDNKTLSAIAATSKSPLATGIRMLREVEQALPKLADQIAVDPDAKHIKAVYGVTMIYRGADRLGFEVFELPDGWFSRTSRIYLPLLMKVLTNPNRKNKLKKSTKKKQEPITPHMLLMSAERISGYATSQIHQLRSKAERSNKSVDLPLVDSLEEAAQLNNKTTVM